MKYRKSFACIFAVAILSTSAANIALAEESAVSANVTLATDYRFRGISQGDRSPAIQGGFDLALQGGFYAGVWASNVTFSGAAIEMDFYAGYGGNINDGISYDVGYLYYAYPEDDADPDLDYQEFYASVSMADATVGVAYSNDYFAETDAFWYLYGEYELSPLENLTLGLHLALNKFDSDSAFARFIGPGVGENPGDSYLDWTVSAATQYYGVEWGLAFVGTNLDEDECFGGTKLCNNTIVLSLTKSL